MKKLPLFFVLFIFALFNSCTDLDDDITTIQTNKVLMLKVDYLTNNFLGGKELIFGNLNSNFTVTKEYTPPTDFGNLKLKYLELNSPIFEGSIVWAGLGEMTYPTDLLAASSFENVMTADYVTPSEGFVNVFNPNNTTYNYDNVWGAVQGLVKTREYLISNPNGSVKLFLYTPSVGVGNPADWYWVIFIKN